MYHLKRKEVWIISVLSLFLIMAGCGSDEGNTDTESNVSEEMNYTITGLEPGAGQTELNEEAIEAYDSLDGWKQEVSSTGAMLTSISEAIANEEPIIFTAWSPHYKFAKWDLKFLDDPEDIFGIEQSARTLVRLGLKDEMPEAYTLLERFHWELSDIEKSLLVAQEKEIDVVAQEWVDANQETIEEWTEGIEQVDGTSIELVYTPWDDGTFTAEVAKVVFEQLGFSATITPVDPAILFEALATGDADATLAPWLPTTHGELYDASEGEFEDIGSAFTGAKIGLAVPAYMDIDSIEDLQPKE